MTYKKFEGCSMSKMWIKFILHFVICVFFQPDRMIEQFYTDPKSGDFCCLWAWTKKQEL